MPHHHRSPRAVSFFHISNVAAPEAPRCRTPPDYREAQRRLSDALATPPLPLVAYCVLPTGWHLIVGPADPQSLRHCLVRVKDAHPAAPCVTSVVALTDTNALVHAARAVERQALALGLVRRAQDWPWGSLAGRLDGDNPLPLRSAPFLESRAWTEFVNAPGPNHRDSADVAQYPRRLTGIPERRHHLGGI